VNVFYDTNVLLDVILERSPFYSVSADVWTLAETGRADGYISAVSYTNTFYLVAAFRDSNFARESVSKMHGIFIPAAVDGRVISQAIDSDLNDFEDAVQYFSALHAGADCIVSRNVKDFPRRPAIPVLTPEELLAELREGPKGLE
jgi:predicted nucleic acid-binding protein